MRRQKSKGQDYPYRGDHEIAKSLGPRSPRTEKLKEDYASGRLRLRQRLSKLQTRLRAKARVNPNPAVDGAIFV